MHQKDIFLQSEADAWFNRNHAAIAAKDFSSNDPVSSAVVEIATQIAQSDGRLRILEVGCGDGGRLVWLSKHLATEVHGVEPSFMAVEHACARGVKAVRGTAEALPYDDAYFDIVIFGFCLYLCDRQDLFRIAQEADRVLKPDAWIVIHDFFAPTPVRREYHHTSGVYSYKMDYRRLFDWHPAYTCFSQKVWANTIYGFTDDANEWVATSVLRKKAGADE
jgi:ubiquinone/menaquinone biosynthesis C-methylase UbiE